MGGLRGPAARSGRADADKVGEGDARLGGMVLDGPLLGGGQPNTGDDGAAILGCFRVPSVTSVKLV